MLTNPAFWGVMFIFVLCASALFLFIADSWKERLIAFVIILVVSFGITSLMFINDTNQRERWDDGIHGGCGGYYELTSVTEWRGSKSFYYSCKKCGHTEEFDRLMK